MKRLVSRVLDDWLSDTRRKPLVLRGARQVGKTWLIRDLAARSGLDLAELNFERDPGLKKHFLANDPKKIIAELSLVLGKEISPARSILFLDEIQSAGEVLKTLRWFEEEMPSLPVAAAGSLLEFTLSDFPYSVPVGRISFLHIEPMGFREYLAAHGQDGLLSALSSWRPGQELSPAAHEKAAEWFDRYGMVGGMPAVVAEDVAGRKPGGCREMQKDLLAALRIDFAKYRSRMDRDILDVVLKAVAQSIGAKFVYARVAEGVKQHQAKKALELLAAARVCHLVGYTGANGLPLGSESRDRFRKAILGDVGLLHALLGTPAAEAFPSRRDISPSLLGRVAEQIAGQELRLMSGSVGDGPDLFYWQREGGRPGEIDYVAQIHGKIVPVELKAGAAGSMKSLHQFMFEKGLDFAVRIDLNPPSLARVTVKTTMGKPVSFRLMSLPAYLLWRLPEIF